MKFNDRKINILKKLKIIFILLIIISLIWSVYIFFLYQTESRLIYVKKENVVITGTAAGKGSNTRINIHLKNVHDAKSDDVLYGDSVIKVMSYTWTSKLSVNRRLFLDKEKIRNADTLYLYLYKSDNIFLLSSKIFGLSANQPPSKIYLISDILRTTTQLGLGICLVFLVVFYYIEDKYLKGKSEKSTKSKLKFWYLIPIIIMVFIIAS